MDTSNFRFFVVVVHSLSWVQLCDPMDCSTPGFPDPLSPGVCSNKCPLSWWCLIFYVIINEHLSCFQFAIINTTSSSCKRLLKNMLQSSACLVTQLCPTLCNLMDCSPIVSSVYGDSPGKNTGVGCHALLQRNSLNPRIELRSPTLQAGSSLSEPPGKPKVLQIIHLKWAISLPKFSFPK